MSGMFSELANLREQDRSADTTPPSARTRPKRQLVRRDPIPQAVPQATAPEIAPAETVTAPPSPPETAPTPTDAVPPPPLVSVAGEPTGPAFDLGAPADKTNTYSFSKDELWAINDMVQELDRRYDVQVTRYNLVRLAVHCLIEDFRRNKEQGFALQHLPGYPKK
jgi:hypothetical protein